MKKLAILSFLLAATTAAFGQATSTDTKTVNLSVASYVSVAFTGGACTLTINDGGQAGAYDSTAAPFQVLCNVACSITTLTNAGPVGYTWTATSDASSFSAPGGTGNVTAHVSGVTLSNSKALNNATTTVTLTFTEN
jgi:hypothetical protein